MTTLFKTYFSFVVRAHHLDNSLSVQIPGVGGADRILVGIMISLGHFASYEIGLYLGCMDGIWSMHGLKLVQKSM